MLCAWTLGNHLPNSRKSVMARDTLARGACTTISFSIRSVLVSVICNLLVAYCKLGVLERSGRARARLRVPDDIDVVQTIVSDGWGTPGCGRDGETGREAIRLTC